jgi:hypothetical protein
MSKPPKNMLNFARGEELSAIVKTDGSGKYRVWINGDPLRHPHTKRPAEFSSKRNAQRAAIMVIARNRRGFLI